MIGLYGSGLNWVSVAWRKWDFCSLFSYPLERMVYFPPRKKGQHAAITTARAIGRENNRSIQKQKQKTEQWTLTLNGSNETGVCKKLRGICPKAYEGTRVSVTTKDTANPFSHQVTASSNSFSSTQALAPDEKYQVSDHF